MAKRPQGTISRTEIPQIMRNPAAETRAASGSGFHVIPQLGMKKSGVKAFREACLKTL